MGRGLATNYPLSRDLGGEEDLGGEAS
jgi:hypothetical protein